LFQKLKVSAKLSGMLAAAVVLTAGVTIFLLHKPPRSERSETPAASPSAAAVSNQANSAAAGSGAFTNNPAFQARPFSVAQESPRFQWTSADGKDTNVIRQLAHNALEYQRMVEENPRILRRQLVYLKETAAAIMEQSRASGEPVKQLTLPAFDDKEIQFDINRADLEPSKLGGTVAGQIPGHPNSTVTLSFKFGREAFTVISPDDGIYLQAWPREPGQVILTSFDPDIYLAMPEGEPLKTTNTFKIAQ
jgi:hypothetical protein